MLSTDSNRGIKSVGVECVLIVYVCEAERYREREIERERERKKERSRYCNSLPFAAASQSLIERGRG